MDPGSGNLRADNPPDQGPTQHVQSYIDVDMEDVDGTQPRMPIIHPEELIGRTIGITQENGQTTQLCIIEAINEQLNDT